MAAVGAMAAVAALLLATATANAGTNAYPGGGSGFDSNAEGWTPGGASCAPLALLCTPEAAYDAEVGNPPGSLAARTTVTLNLVNLFKGTAVWSSPQFTVPVGAVTGASVRLDRAFDPGGLIDVEPKGAYTVTLRDLSDGTSSTALAEQVTKADSTFATRSANTSVVGGHTYQLSIEATTAQSLLALSILSGTTSLRFDNVGLRVETRDDNGGGGNGGGGGDGASGGDGAGGLSDGRLLSLLKSEAVGPAVLKGKRLFVKGACPAKVGRSCRLSLQGLVNRRKPATTRRISKVAKGRARTLVLRVKPKARSKLARSNRLLFRETVRAGTAKATLYKRLKLIRRR
jgi:hypothetical protein